MPAPSVSDAEWEVMRIAWESSPLTAAQIVEQLAKPGGWSPRTIKSLINRLLKKKALTFEARGNRYLYRPAVTRQECVRHRSRSFLGRVFEGAVGPMLVHFVEQADLSREEIAELQRILAQKHKPRGRKGRPR